MAARILPAPDSPAPSPAAPYVAWLGDATADELALARWWAGSLVAVRDADDDADGLPAPAIALLAAELPAAWSLPAAAAVSRRWPLTPLLTVVTSLADGRRRSGPWLPGVEEVAWHDLPGRLTWWLAELAAGRRGSLGLPATARREERLADAAAHVRWVVAAAGPPPEVSIAGPCRDSLAGLAAVITAAGCSVVGQTRGRPRLDDDAQLLVWDVGQATGTDLAWLALLAANRPQVGIVLLDSFPRGDSARAALRAGAHAVLARPAGLEPLVGTLLWRQHGRRSALGAGGPVG
jgi:hypothetical protein